MIYLDHNASTPVAEPVLRAMLPHFGERFANAASRSHDPGRAAGDAVERARAQLAAMLGAKPATLTFTSGATEAVNLAIQGFVRARQDRAGGERPAHVVTAAHEHPAGLEACRAMGRQGAEVTEIRPGADGVVTAGMVEAELRDDTALVSIMWANNELGTINEIEAIAELCRRRQIPLHTDATQWVGKMPTDLAKLPGVSMLSLSAHKFYGPKGAGALFVRDLEATPIAPLVHGGGHERRLRPGTPNTPAIVGLGAAAELAAASMQSDADRLAPLRDRLEAELLRAIPGGFINGATAPDRRLYQTTNLTFPNVDPDLMLTALAGVAVSSGSACGSGSLAPSPVLQAIGHDPDRRDTLTLRLSLGRSTAASDIDVAVAAIADAASIAVA